MSKIDGPFHWEFRILMFFICRCQGKNRSYGNEMLSQSNAVFVLLVTILPRRIW